MEAKRVQLHWSLLRATSKLMRITKGNLEQFGLSGPEYRILLSLGGEEMTLSELSQQLLKVNSNITAIVDNLQSKRLVQRVADSSDRRVIRVRLTEAGKTLRAQAVPSQSRFINEIFAKLTDEETGQLLHLIGKVEKICDVKSNPLTRTVKEGGICAPSLPGETGSVQCTMDN
jgi:DNA-binding MarR family transcriptional regulator